MPLSEEKVAREVDVRGQICPYPLIETQNGLKGIEPGEVLLVLTDNEPSAKETIPALCGRKSYPFEAVEDGAGGWRVFIRRTA